MKEVNYKSIEFYFLQPKAMIALCNNSPLAWSRMAAKKIVSLNERGKGGIGACQRFSIDGKDKLTSFIIYKARDVKISCTQLHSPYESANFFKHVQASSAQNVHCGHFSRTFHMNLYESLDVLNHPLIINV
jgi:hypothetical protein